MELAELCKELNNYFNCDKYRDGIPGKYVIDHGILDLSELITKGALQDGQFFRLSGSVFNDDVYQFSTSTPNDMTDETFEGILWPMSVPREVTSLLSDINLWISKYGTKKTCTTIIKTFYYSFFSKYTRKKSTKYSQKY